MPRGPLPDPHAQRRNKSTIPTTDLPADGRAGDPPAVPSWVELGPPAMAWWNWAWATPEAAAWGESAVAVAARRAQLEDDLAAVDLVTRANVHEVVDVERGVDDTIDMLDDIFRHLGKLAGGKLKLIQEATKLDGELGLTPKARQQLRWTIKETTPAAPPQVEGAPEGGGSRGRLRVVPADERSA